VGGGVNTIKTLKLEEGGGCMTSPAPLKLEEGGGCMTSPAPMVAPPLRAFTLRLSCTAST